MMEKSFLDRPLCLLCLAAVQEITHVIHSLSRLGELQATCVNPSSWVARLAGAPLERQLLFRGMYGPVKGY